MNYGNIGKRFAAWLIDSAIVSSVSWMIAWMFISASADRRLLIRSEYFLEGRMPSEDMLRVLFEDGFIAWIAIVPPLIAMLYHAAMEGSGIHATVGKLALKLYVADVFGNGVSFGRAMLRYISRFFSAITFFVGFLLCEFSPEKQCLHDMIAKTYVLAGRPGRAEPAVSRHTGYEPMLLCVSGPLGGMSFPIPESGLTVGRDANNCQVVLPSTESHVSRVHCHVLYSSSSQMFILDDNQSTQGTYLDNDMRVEAGKSAALPSGTRFYAATRENMFEVR